MIIKLHLRGLVLIGLLSGSLCLDARDDTRRILVGDTRLSMNFKASCEVPSVTKEELVKNLGQYNPTGDPRSDLDDESRWTPAEVRELRKHLIEFGFIYPNGSESVITWMDIDGDRKCDFTVTVGIGGARPIDRMMLFKGIGDGKFTLVDSHLSYMDTAITVVPYIPVSIVGEKAPLIIVPRDGRMLRWRQDGEGFSVCDANVPSGRPRRLENVYSSNFTTLCDAFWEIAEWAEQQLPKNNRIASWRK